MRCMCFAIRGTFACGGGDGTLSECEAGNRLRSRGFFYEFLPRAAFHSGRFGKIKRRCVSWRRRICERAQAFAESRSDRPYKKTNQVFKVRACGRKSHGADGVVLHHGEIHRFLPRAAYSSTKRIQAFKLMSVAGGVWKGQEATRNCSGFMRWLFLTQKKSWMNICTGWKRRSGATIAVGTELELFSVQEEAGPD